MKPYIENKMVSGFFGYSSKDESIVEAIERAVEEINKATNVEIITWKQLLTSGKIIIKEICKAIDNRDVFLCDLTDWNPNVLFELGYAIATNKHIWIILNISIEGVANDYRRFGILSGVGYSTFANSNDISSKFFSEALTGVGQSESTILTESMMNLPPRDEKPIILYLKSKVDTDASVDLTKRVCKMPSIVITNDPVEVENQSIRWYVEKTHQSIGLIAHFLGDNHKEHKMHNARYAFISGLAFGFDIPLLMLAHSPYECPLDYQEIMKVHSTAAECFAFADLWMNERETYIREQNDEYKSYKTHLKGQHVLSSINMGESVAENEQNQLDEYYVETGVFAEALRTSQKLIVGKKGTGKTAILYQLEKHFRADKRNHVCIIKPLSYDLAGVITIVSQIIDIGEQGYLIESFWKYLIYSELAKSVAEELENRPIGSLNQNEDDFLGYVNKHSDLIRKDFSVRLENAVKVIIRSNHPDIQNGRKIKISEILHDEIIRYIRAKIGSILKGKNRVCILVDNLDKVWDPRTDLEIPGQWLLGLLGVSRRITEELATKDRWRDSLSISLVVFIRSDIYYKITRNVRERDKLSEISINWDDSRTLQRVIEERIHYSVGGVASPERMWEAFFTRNVNAIATKEYLAQVILPRPRDIIYFTKGALSTAISRGHTMIEEDDILSAERQYSAYALDSLVAENPDIEELLYEFAGAHCYISRDEIGKYVNNVMKTEDLSELNAIIDTLFRMGFIGREIKERIFEFLMDENEERIVIAKAKKYCENIPDGERFCINRAFHAYLGIEGSDLLFKMPGRNTWSLENRIKND